MSVVIETTVDNLVIDLDFENYTIECYNFVKLCRSGFYNYQCFHDLRKNISIEFGDPLFAFNDREDIRVHNTSVEGIIDKDNITPRLIKSTTTRRDMEGSLGDIGFILKSSDTPLIGSQILISLSELPHLYKNTIMFGKLIDTTNANTLAAINNCASDNNLRPTVDIRIKKIHILHDPFPNRQPIPQLYPPLPINDIRLPLPANDIPDGSPIDTYKREIIRKELTLEIIGDIYKAGIKPAENVLFICKLNPLTKAEHIATIFERFGDVLSVEIVRDKKTGNSLGYGFIEFETKEACEQAYSKMDNTLIDDRRIHVDFSQSIAKAF
ncbi:PPIL4 family peptidylprolyl isomerase Ecym_1121 [Eremothecium cymbalariae DBVPG|uniref:Peptidyl-prolyl cis-trans isomerase n=1 Tax=Eremothecium cymbalariae (strain CBS 270.75 / DBVPG 7215 / KCTC 17166 / NRRL Y-17582) TaxID=931890 RepID=G8JMM0_ERECY|nr:hypothetical protein Ecym_1121 [Eremothecium cymbalariae DBVPG\